MSYHLSSQDLFNKGFFYFINCFTFSLVGCYFYHLCQGQEVDILGPNQLKAPPFLSTREESGKLRDKEKHEDDGLETKGGDIEVVGQRTEKE